ncbi:TetR/AcrR family transcriptional regulator [Micromonospora sp. NPDC049903]|uniref:TetR/AcrR family transcriptional regulator n=1 Tax=Micromonospora sp. NPDC049903 TaxID=3364276 RepID=UPI0037BAB7F6
MPKQVDPDQRRRLVADAVLDEILDNGIQSVTLARIAQRTGLAIGSIRHFFTGHDEMLTFTFSVVVSRMSDRLGGEGAAAGGEGGAGGGEGVVAGPTGTNALDAIGALLLRSAPGQVPHRENVAYLEYLMRARTVPHLRAELARIQAEGERIIADLVRGALAGTTASEADTRLEAAAITAMLNGLALTDAYAPEPLAAHDVRQIVTRMLERLRGAYPTRCGVPRR